MAFLLSRIYLEVSFQKFKVWPNEKLTSLLRRLQMNYTRLQMIITILQMKSPLKLLIAKLIYIICFRDISDEDENQMNNYLNMV